MRPSATGSDPQAAGDGFLLVGAVGEFPLNAIRLVTVRGRSVGVIRTPEAIYAVRNVCPHQGAPICRGTFGGTFVPSQPGTKEYGLANRVLRCPWHAWEFDVATGEALFGISDKRLVTYGVEVRDNEVFLRLQPSGGRTR